MKTKVTQKSVVEYLRGIHPVKQSFDEIAEHMGLSGVALVDLQYALSRLCQIGRIVKVEGYLYKFSR